MFLLLQILPFSKLYSVLITLFKLVLANLSISCLLLIWWTFLSCHFSALCSFFLWSTLPFTSGAPHSWISVYFSDSSVSLSLYLSLSVSVCLSACLSLSSLWLFFYLFLDVFVFHNIALGILSSSLLLHVLWLGEFIYSSGFLYQPQGEDSQVRYLMWTLAKIHLTATKIS